MYGAKWCLNINKQLWFLPIRSLRFLIRRSLIYCFLLVCNTLLLYPFSRPKDDITLPVLFLLSHLESCSINDLCFLLCLQLLSFSAPSLSLTYDQVLPFQQNHNKIFLSFYNAFEFLDNLDFSHHSLFFLIPQCLIYLTCNPPAMQETLV